MGGEDETIGVSKKKKILISLPAPQKFSAEWVSNNLLAPRLVIQASNKVISPLVPRKILVDHDSRRHKERERKSLHMNSDTTTPINRIWKESQIDQRVNFQEEKDRGACFDWVFFEVRRGVLVNFEIEECGCGFVTREELKRTREGIDEGSISDGCSFSKHILICQNYPFSLTYLNHPNLIQELDCNN